MPISVYIKSVEKSNDFEKLRKNAELISKKKRVKIITLFKYLSKYIEKGYVLVNYDGDYYKVYPNNLIVLIDSTGRPCKKFTCYKNLVVEENICYKYFVSYDWEKFRLGHKRDVEAIIQEDINDPELWLLLKQELDNYDELPSKEDILAIYNTLKIINNL